MTWSRPEVMHAQEVVGVLAGRWVLPVLQALTERRQRSGELHIAVGGVSDQVFYDTLIRLERQGLISRDTTSPQHGTYSLTDTGRRAVQLAGQVAARLTESSEANAPDSEPRTATEYLYAIAGKWVVPILIALHEGMARPMAISAHVQRITNTAISDKARHETLRRLTERRLVTRTRSEGAPPISEYRLTGAGRTALALVHSFADLDTTQERVQDGAPDGLDPAVPSAARMYDYYLGGKDNFPVDREAAERIFGIDPNVPAIARANRRFLVRAVQYVAEAGVRQFLDLGTGIPTSPNVHETVDHVHQDGRVVYVDNDRVVMAHSRTLLETHDHVVAVDADIRRPNNVLSDPSVQRLIDFSEPVAVLLVSVLHFFDDADAQRIVDGFMRRLAPGSYLVISTATSDGVDDVDRTEAEEIYARARTRAVARTSEEIARFFAGCEMVEPGLVRVERWRADEPVTRGSLLGGVGRIGG